MKPGLLLLMFAAPMAGVALAQAPAPAPAAAAAPRYVPEDHRPALLFREDFNNEPEETPITQASIANKSLSFGLYGPGKDGVAKSHHASPKDDPSYVWLGSCLQACGFTLRHKDSYADLTGLAKIRWRRLDTKVMNDGPWVEKPDLSKVDEIGWTDLATGSGHGSGGLVGSSRIDWIEVYGAGVKRP